MLDFGMMTIYLIALTIITAAGLMLVFLSVDLKLVCSGMKNGIKSNFYRVSNMINDIENSRLAKLVNITETRIQKSNIRMHMPFYNGLIHFIICSITAMILFNWIKGYTNAIVSVVFSVVGLYMPYAMLQMFEDLMNNKVKKHVVDFLAILKNFLVATGDVFQAFDKGKEYFIEPLKSHVGIMVYEYRHKISAVKCINNLTEKLQHREFKLFFENLKICYTHGGDIVGLIDEYINEISMLNDDADKEDAQDAVLKGGLYVMLFLNFGILSFVLNSKYAMDITHTLMGNIMLIADILISLYILHSILGKVN